jgi:hypothetical protein
LQCFSNQTGVITERGVHDAQVVASVPDEVPKSPVIEHNGILLRDFLRNYDYSLPERVFGQPVDSLQLLSVQGLHPYIALLLLLQRHWNKSVSLDSLFDMRIVVKDFNIVRLSSTFTQHLLFMFDRHIIHG